MNDPLNLFIVDVKHHDNVEGVQSQATINTEVHNDQAPVKKLFAWTYIWTSYKVVVICIIGKTN